MAKKPGFDSEGYQENINRVSRRLLVLEREHQKENLYIKSRDERLETLVDSFQKQIQQIREELELVGENLNMLNKTINLVGKSVQDIAKKDELEKVEERIDNWPLEQFIKRD
jgi:archaellum component FlaC